mmetsp:Transcript_7073/g.7944  ORF Transcript_7073/g.7944 Transcript_7073/m.7944 type:complete len:105 (-) Transcript_7073:40-354(-)
MLEIYQKFEDQLEKSGSTYFVSNEGPSLADFYVFTLIFSVMDKGLIDLNQHPKLQKWFAVMELIPSLANIRTRARRFMWFVYFVGGYIFPIVRCLTCKRRRNLE